MPNQQELQQFVGADAVGPDGKIGSIADIYVDEDTGQPEWMAIKTGLFGTKVSFAPLAEASMQGNEVRVPYSKAQVKDAPNADADGALSQEEEAALYRHYGLPYSEQRSDSGLPQGGAPAPAAAPTPAPAATGDPTPMGGPTGNDVSGQETDDAMTRSEEEVRVGVAQREAGRVRLRKFIVSEQVQQTVPVQREQVRVEREPITAANMPAAMDGPALSEEEHEVTLRAEEAVVEKTVVPKERVRLDKDVVTEQRTVQETVRGERIELVDGDNAPPTGIDGERGTDEGIR